MAARLIITGLALDGWIYWQILLQSLVITINLQPNPSSLTAEDSPHSHSRSKTGCWFTTGLLTCIILRWTHRKDIRCPAMDIYADHIENTSSSIVVFTAPLHRNGSYPIVACVFVFAGMCLPNHCPATGLRTSQYLYWTQWLFTFQENFCSILVETHKSRGRTRNSWNDGDCY
jgi:hypothetical protein